MSSSFFLESEILEANDALDCGLAGLATLEYEPLASLVAPLTAGEAMMGDKVEEVKVARPRMSAGEDHFGKCFATRPARIWWPIELSCSSLIPVQSTNDTAGRSERREEGVLRKSPGL